MTGRRKEGRGRTTGLKGCFSACFHPSTLNDKPVKPEETDAPQTGTGGKGVISKSEKERSLGRVYNSAPEVILHQEVQDFHKKAPESQVEALPQNTSEKGEFPAAEKIAFPAAENFDFPAAEKVDFPAAEKESPLKVSQEPPAAPASTIGKGINTVVKQVVGKEEPAKTYHDLGKHTIQKTADVGAGTTATIGNAALDVGATTLGLVEGTALSAVQGVQHAAHVTNKTIHTPIAKTADTVVDTTAYVTGVASDIGHGANVATHNVVATVADSISDTVHPPIARTADTVVHSAALVSGVTAEVASQGTGLVQHGAHMTNKTIHDAVAKVADTVVDTTVTTAETVQHAAHVSNKTIHDVVAPVADVAAMPFEAVAAVPRLAYDAVSYVVGASPNKAERSTDADHGTEARGGFGIPVSQDLKDKHYEGRETAKYLVGRGRS